MTTHPTADRLYAVVMSALTDIKAQDIYSIDVTGKTSVTDNMIIATGTSTTHIKAVVDHVEQKVKEQGNWPIRREGDAVSEWVLLDLGDVIVHVLTQAMRRYYDLESLWDGVAVAAKRP